MKTTCGRGAPLPPGPLVVVMIVVALALGCRRAKVEQKQLEADLHLALPKMLDTTKLAADIQADMAKKDVIMSGMSCPPEELAKATTFPCTGQDSNGTTAIFDVTSAGDAKGTVSWKLRGKYENIQVVGDRLEKSLSTPRQAVDVTCPSQNIIIQQGVTFECDAKVGTKVRRYVFKAKSDQGDWDAKITST